ncbi:MAG: glucosaminidase domain-containing protein [Prevotellaceae bacterium]|nr:glucosaminidase domain-containing protein [Candidatus Minthosoma equi]
MRSYFFALALLFASSIFAQQRNAVYQQYIDQYKDMAIEQMRQHHIPASITLAQGLLESAAGRSELARKANNHFGIKVSSDWKGPYSVHDDDRKGEKFRKYSKVEDSFNDHSLFLKRQRYSSLFQLDPMDYKAWARGLKACGYATSPTYAQRLIDIIELYDLHDYDEDRYGLKPKKYKQEVVTSTRHTVTQVNGINCIVARSGDTWDALAKETKIKKKKLLAFNEVDEDFTIPAGMNIFLAKKAKKADDKYKDTWHKIQQGESMYTISQFYGIRIENLYKMNFKDESYVPAAGDLLKVR